jgi:hypothetical protein
MLAALQGSQGSVLIIHLPDPEAKLYAERVAAIISDGGWQVSFAGGSPFGATFGFILTTKDGSNLRATTGALRSALESAFGSDKVALTSQASMKEDEVRLTVGMKRME